MITRNLLALAVRSLAGRRASSVAPLLSLAMATGTTFVLLSIAWSLHGAGVSGLLSRLPITRMVVTARQVDLLFLRLGTPLSSLDDRSLQSVRAIEGVEAAWPELVLAMPVSLVGDLLGTTFSTDCAVYGVGGDFFPAGNRPPGFVHREPGAAVPVVLSSQLIDLYNSGFAGSQNLPGLSRNALVGRHFTLFLGTSSFVPALPRDRVLSVRCEVVGLSDAVSVTGVTAPEAYAREWHRWFHGESTPVQYSSIHVEAASSSIVDRVRRDIESLGLQISNPRELAEKIALLSKYLSAAIAAIVVLFLVMAGVGTASTLGLEVTHQAERIGVYRALGASQSDVRRIYMARAAVLGLAGATLGLLPAIGLQVVMGNALEALVPIAANLPPSWREFNPALALISLSLGLATCVVAGIAPAHRAARLDPADALRRAGT
ncbi:MAG: ABC transporter permease [Candidatus Eisenbacteria bacterium]|nr:ABC transporter permease [Candidatus Eisenbacteria bacterium]